MYYMQRENALWHRTIHLSLISERDTCANELCFANKDKLQRELRIIVFIQLGLYA